MAQRSEHKRCNPKAFNEHRIIYDDRCLIGNWYERRQLDEFQNRFGLWSVKHLERYRTMVKNVNAPSELSLSLDRVPYGTKIMIIAPYVKSDPCPSVKKRGLSLGPRVLPNYLPYAQDFRPNFRIIGYKELVPTKKNTFIILNSEPCKFKSDELRYYEPFSLVLAATKEEGKMPLYVRYVMNPTPGVTDPYPLELCDTADCAAQWRVLPVLKPNITRLEQRGDIVPPNADIVINHRASNINLGMKPDLWARDYYDHVGVPFMKTCVDAHKRELPYNLWHICTEPPRPIEKPKDPLI